MARPPVFVRPSIAAVATLCASLAWGQDPPPGAAAPAAPAPPAAGAPAAPPPAPAALKPYAEVIKDAKEHPGFFRYYEKDEKVWLEIKPEQFDQPFFMQVNRTSGLGDRGVFVNPMLSAHVVTLHKVGNLVQLIAKNSRFNAKEGTALARAARESLSDSLLASANVLSQPHHDRKSVLIEAN